MLFLCLECVVWFFFFFNDTATTEIYTLSLHDALPISPPALGGAYWYFDRVVLGMVGAREDRKSTRLNSSHPSISYAVFCLKKKKPHYSHAPHVHPGLNEARPRVCIRRVQYSGHRLYLT